MARGGRRSTSFKKGDPRNPGRRENRDKYGTGRRKGTVNKISGDLRQAILDALNDDRLGGLEWFIKLGQRDLRSMAGLVGKALPQKIETGVDPDEAARRIRERMRAMNDLTQPTPTPTPEEEEEK